MRFRPSFFPFTEPSVEVDVSCSACGGKGCRVCKGAGWIEILGAGMRPTPECWQAAVSIRKSIPGSHSESVWDPADKRTRYKISDIRLLFENDQRFLEQFN